MYEDRHAEVVDRYAAYIVQSAALYQHSGQAPLQIVVVHEYLLEHIQDKDGRVAFGYEQAGEPGEGLAISRLAHHHHPDAGDIHRMCPQIFDVREIAEVLLQSGHIGIKHGAGQYVLRVADRARHRDAYLVQLFIYEIERQQEAVVVGVAVRHGSLLVLGKC